MITHCSHFTVSLQSKVRAAFGLVLFFVAVSLCAQTVSPLDELKADPRKAYGTDYPYSFEKVTLTKAPKGYKPFYISHYGRHGSRYSWSDRLYYELDSLLTKAHQKQLLTAEGEAFYNKFMASKEELKTGISELTQLGWEQHQFIARTMYNNFPQVFKKGGNVLAISSLSGRCVLSMSAFCQELVQCNPKIEIREQSSRFTLDGVVPTDRQNPVKHRFPRVTPRYEKNKDRFKYEDNLRDKIIPRVFTSTEGLPGNLHHIGSNLINLYTSLPSIGHEGMMGNIITDQEIVDQWENSNLGSYSWVFGPQNDMIPVLQDIIRKAEAAINGTSDHIADLRGVVQGKAADEPRLRVQDACVAGKFVVVRAVQFPEPRRQRMVQIDLQHQLRFHTAVFRARHLAERLFHAH